MSKNIAIIGGGVIGLCSAYWISHDVIFLFIEDRDNMDRIVWKMRFLRMIPNNKKMDRKNHPVESSNKNPESLGISCHVILCPILYLT